MNSKQLNIFKIILFIFGIAIVGVAFMLINYPLPEEGLTPGQKFFWFEIFLCWLIFFIPFFFSSISINSVDTKITSTVNIWICVIIFEIIAITFAILSLNDVVPIKTSILIELFVFFISAIFVYFGYFAGNHIGKVQAEEQKSLNKIAELKSTFELLNLKTEMWNENFYTQKEKVKKLCDDVRYISPVTTDLASNLEMKLIISANAIMESTVTPTEMDTKILELTNLINQRKLLKN